MGGGGKAPTLEEIGNTAIDAAAAGLTFGYTQTESGKSDLKNVKKGAKQAYDMVSGETARKAAEAEVKKALGQEQAQDRAMRDAELKKRKAGEYGQARARQKALMADTSGRGSTILTGATGGSAAGLGGAASGKTLLGQ